MMHLCRELFPTILETPGLLFKLLSDNFAYNKFLYDDIIEQRLEEVFKDYIYSFITINKKRVVTNKSPKELLSEAGYVLYECKTEDDIQKFKKYYDKEEVLCTFDGGRLNRCYVFFAVKKNVDEIERKNFDNPKREDEYGSSVISIQFSKGEQNTLSIKNRYNHIVKNPDATFRNNLDNIIDGLTESFEREYNLNINQNFSELFEIENYVKANDGKYYKYNIEINDVYYCPNNIIIDNFEVIKKYDEKEKYIILDYFVLDLINKELKLYDETIEDSFIDDFTDIQKCEVENKDGNKVIHIFYNSGKVAIIKLDNKNQIIYYKNEKIYSIKNNFLYYNEALKYIQLDNVIKIGKSFLKYNDEKIDLYFPNLMVVGDDFLTWNDNVEILDFPKLEKVGSNFLFSGENNLSKIDFPNLKFVGKNFLFCNNSLKEFEFPKLRYKGSGFLNNNSDYMKIKKVKVLK